MEKFKVLILGLFVAMAFVDAISVGAITVTPDDDAAPGIQVNPVAGITKQINATATVTELSGYANINQTAGNATCSWSYPNETVLYTTNVAWTNCDGTTCDATCSADFQFYDDPTDYNVTLTAYNTTDSSSSNSSIFTYAELVAFNLGFSTINFGASFAPGTGQGTSNKTETVTNLGNVMIDIIVNGTVMSHASLAPSIPVGSLYYDITSNAMGSETALSAVATTVSLFDLIKGASSTKDSWWDLHVPAGSAQWVPAGTYSGTITISAVKST